MLAIAKRLGIVTFCVVAAVSVVLPGETPVEARGPVGAPYCPAPGEVFWFVHASDLHIGASGSTRHRQPELARDHRAQHHQAAVHGRDRRPDRRRTALFGYPNGPYIEEWTAYRAILDAAGVTDQDYFDLPGNHDAYNDASSAYYKAYAIQGATVRGATGRSRGRRTVPGVRTYHFLGVNTAGNNGAPFSFLGTLGDHAGLDHDELVRCRRTWPRNAARPNLTFVFGHHPVSGTGTTRTPTCTTGRLQFVGLPRQLRRARLRLRARARQRRDVLHRQQLHRRSSARASATRASIRSARTARSAFGSCRWTATGSTRCSSPTTPGRSC